jgi:hypothetical protein
MDSSVSLRGLDADDANAMQNSLQAAPLLDREGKRAGRTRITRTPKDFCWWPLARWCSGGLMPSPRANSDTTTPPSPSSEGKSSGEERREGDDIQATPDIFWRQVNTMRLYGEQRAHWEQGTEKKADGCRGAGKEKVRLRPEGEVCVGSGGRRSLS